MGALEEILQRHPIWRGGALAKGVAALPTGFAPLDAELPGGGWPRQGLTEILADEAGWASAVMSVRRGGPPLAAPFSLPRKRPFNVLGRAHLPRPRGRDARAARRLGLPVHA